MNGDSLVPYSYVSGSGYNLGSMLANVRSSGYFWKGHPFGRGERVKWFESLPKWTWSCHDSAWETFQKEMEDYVDENGTSLVSIIYVSVKYNLGMILSNVRSDGRLWKGKDDEGEEGVARKFEKEWTWSCHDSAWETFKKEMQAYVDENGTSLVHSHISPSGPQSRNASERCPFKWPVLEGKHDEERKAWLENLKEVDVNCYDSAWEKISKGDGGLRG